MATNMAPEGDQGRAGTRQTSLPVLPRSQRRQLSSSPDPGFEDDCQKQVTLRWCSICDNSVESFQVISQ